MDQMKTLDTVGITFVNNVLGTGTLNGVVNITFGAFQFTPTETAIDPDLVVAVRLRMDESCAKQLYASLDALFNTPKVEAGADAPAAEAKLN